MDNDQQSLHESAGQVTRQKPEPISVQALKSGDRSEYARFVDAYSSVIYRLAMKLLNNPQDAEDVLQETFIKAFRHIDRFDERSSLSTWLFRIATNEALMLLRRHKRPMVSLDEPAESEEGEGEPLQIVDWCCLPEEELLSSEARQHLDQAVEQLPDRLRVVFVLRDLEGLSTEETSQVLNLSLTAVKTRLSRARLHLRQLLSTYYQEKFLLKQASQQRDEI